jgi:hypothetical protein
LIHIDFQLNQIINGTDDADSAAKNSNLTTSSITCKACNTESEECAPKTACARIATKN